MQGEKLPRFTAEQSMWLWGKFCSIAITLIYSEGWKRKPLGYPEGEAWLETWHLLDPLTVPWSRQKISWLHSYCCTASARMPGIQSLRRCWGVPATLPAACSPQWCERCETQWQQWRAAKRKRNSLQWSLFLCFPWNIKCHRTHCSPTSELQSSGGLWKYGLDVLNDRDFTVSWASLRKHFPLAVLPDTRAVHLSIRAKHAPVLALSRLISTFLHLFWLLHISAIPPPKKKYARILTRMTTTSRMFQMLVKYWNLWIRSSKASSTT